MCRQKLKHWGLIQLMRKINHARRQGCILIFKKDLDIKDSVELRRTNC